MTDLPQGWELVTLGDVVDVLDSRRVPVNAAERANRVGSVPYYGATGQVGWIDGALFDEELVLLGEDGAPFLDPSKPKAYLIDGPSWVNNHAHVLTARTATTNRFLKYALDATDYRPHVNGTTRLKLTQGAMRNIPVALPPVAEQERIVAAIEEHLSRLDAAEAALASARSRATSLRASLLEQVTAGTWEVRPLGEVLTLLRNGCFISRPKLQPPGLPILRISAVRPLVLDASDVRYAPDDLDRAEEFKVCEGDLLFTRYSGNPDYVGACAVAPAAAIGVLHPDKLIRGVPDRTVALAEWVALAMSASNGRRAVEQRLKTTAGQVGISGAQLKSVPIPVPPLATQAERVAEWTRGFEALGRLHSDLAPAMGQAAALRRSILAAAFSGRLVPQDSSDEPASVLLARIRAERAASGPSKRTRKARSA